MAIEIFSDIDQLVEIGHRLGYNGGGSQLKPGSLRIQRENYSIGELTVVRHTARGAVDYWGDPPGDHITFIIPLKFQHYRVNLEAPLADEIILIPPTSELAITTHGHDQIILYVPTTLIKIYTNCVTRNVLGWFDRVRRLKMTQSDRHELINLLCAPCNTPRHDLDLHNLEHLICELLAALLRVQDPDDNDVDLRIRARMKTLQRARNYMLNHMDTHVSVHDISEVAGVSERTLQRLFRREFELGPLQYLKAQRLEAVRHALIQESSNGVSISTLAFRHGFAHMGRFSMDFKLQFGSLPTELRIKR